MIQLIGPGGAGKSTIGALLAERLDVIFVDLDRHLAGRVGDISEYISRHGYDTYTRENVRLFTRYGFSGARSVLSAAARIANCAIAPPSVDPRRRMRSARCTII